MEKLALEKVKELYGLEFTKRLEQLFRNETAHFKSGNYKKTFSPGMEATKDIFPYGWKSLLLFWINNPQHAPIGIYKQVENTSALAKSRGTRSFIQFASPLASMMTVAYLIEIRGGKFGSWFSTNPKSQKAYEDELDKIKVRLIK